MEIKIETIYSDLSEEFVNDYIQNFRKDFTADEIKDFKNGHTVSINKDNPDGKGKGKTTFTLKR